MKREVTDRQCVLGSSEYPETSRSLIGCLWHRKYELRKVKSEDDSDTSLRNLVFFPFIYVIGNY